MKILQALVFPLWGSGSGTYARKLCESLIRQGHEVAIVAPEERTVKGLKIYPLGMPLKAVFTIHPEWPEAKRYTDLSDHEISELYTAYFKSIVKAVEDFKPDVIHIHHCSMLTWVASYIKGIYGINYIVTAHGTGIMAASVDSRYLALTKDALQRAEYIAPNSSFTKKRLIKVFSRRLDWKCRVIPGGIDLHAFPRNLSVKSVEKKYGLEGKSVVLFSGKLVKTKGTEYLVKAAPKIKGDIYIMGDGDERPVLEKLAQDIGAKNVHFLGHFAKDKTEDMYMLYKRADVVVFPSIWDEPLGLVPLEAMVCSTPVVASKKGGIPLAVKNGYNGYLVRARSAKEIAVYVNKILANPDLRARLAENARKTVEEKFSWELIAKQFVKLYDEAVRKAKNSRQLRKLLREQKQREIESQKHEISTHRVET